jgi:hypothetical protein
MIRPQSLVVLAALAAVLAAGCEREPPAPRLAPTPPVQPVRPAPTGPVVLVKGKTLAGCDLPTAVTGDVRVISGCNVRVDAAVVVDEGATLTIQAGARLAFGPEGSLRVARGRLIARGEPTRPVVFTSNAPTPAPGDWIGVVLEGGTLEGTVLEHAVVEFAGKTGGPGHGGLTLSGAGGPGRVAVVQSIIRSNGQAGIVNVSDAGTFARLERNTLSGNGTSLRLHADVLGSVGPGNVLGDPVHVEGNVTRSATWPRLEVPIVVDGNVTVGGDRAPAILTLAEKTALRFAPDSYLWLGGEGSGGGLVARAVTFSSASSPAAAGDWVGLIVDAKAAGTILEGCIIEHAGHAGGYGHGAVTFTGGARPGPGVSLTKTQFRAVRGAAIAAPGGDCGALATAASSNRATGAPLCAKAD